MPVRWPDASTDPSGLVELQTPPPTRSLNGIVAPAHTELAPLMLLGILFTVTTIVAAQPAAEKEIVAVPTTSAVTTPDEPTDAM